jgi:membrane protein
MNLNATDTAEKVRSTWSVLLRAVWRGLVAWFDDDGLQLGAAVSFYSIFALAPVLVVTIAVAGAVFGADAARGHIVDEISVLVGTAAARNIEAMIASAWRSDGGGFAAAIGLVTLLAAATGVFTELRRALNVMFGIEADPSVLRGLVRARVMAFALLLGFGFLLIVSLILSAALAAAAHAFAARYPLAASALALTDIVTSVLVIALAFAVILRGLPDRAPSWRAIAIGAATGAVLFSLGKHLVGLYLVSAGVASSYGAAGSFVVVIFWVYYSTQVLLVGAAIGRHVAAVHDGRLRHASPISRRVNAR